MAQRIGILIADDHPMVIDGLAGYFNGRLEMEVRATVNIAEQVVKTIEQTNPDVVLLDYHFTHSQLTGLDITREIRQMQLPVGIIIISSFDEVALVKSFMNAGANGYLLKTAAKNDFIEAVQQVYTGGSWFSHEIKDLLLKDKLTGANELKPKFTRTEKEILNLILEGVSTRDMAKQTFREKSTIDSHRKNILYKLQQLAGEPENASKNILYYAAKLNLRKDLENI
jgi:DNA-binding NarL/FixJ family response regulator